MVDASAATSALLSAGPARAAVGVEQVHAPHLVDVEVAGALRRHVAAGSLARGDAWTALDTWRRLGLTRHAGAALLDRVWQLRANVSPYDAMYVALGCALLTAERRLSRAPGLRCPVTVVPR